MTDTPSPAATMAVVIWQSAAIWGIWVHEDEDVVDKLIDLVKRDPDSKVRRDAAWGLGVSRSKRAEKPLLDVIAQDDDEDVRQTAKKSLGSVRHHRPPTTG